MSRPVPPESVPPESEQPESELPEPIEPESTTDPAAEPESLNRAARRAKARKTEPTHVGPRADLDRQTRGGRPHTKRRH